MAGWGLAWIGVPAFDSSLGSVSHTFLPHRSQGLSSITQEQELSSGKELLPLPGAIPVLCTHRTPGFQKELLFLLQDWGAERDGES